MLVQTTEKLSLSASFTKSIILPRSTTNNQKFLRGELKNEGGKGRRVEGEEKYKLQNTNYKQIPNYKFQITNRKTVIGDLVEKERRLKRRLKASKPILHTNSSALCDLQHFAASAAESVQSKKPSGGPKGLIGPPCHGERR
jgi:hypothetical protein